MWFPAWSLGRPDAPAEGAVLVVDTKAGVVACSGVDSDVGPGMPRRQAEALCPDATVLIRDIGEEARRFEPVVCQVEELIPRVEVIEPGKLLIPVTGAVKYYGGEPEVVELLQGKMTAAGHDVRLGLADGPFAAEWAARIAEPGTPLVIEDTRRFLSTLDVGTLSGHDDIVSVFRWLGVTTLGSLADLPREAIASRFGAEGLDVHRLAHGQDRVVGPRPIPPELAVEATYEDPLESLDQLAFAAKATAARLMVGLHREGMSPFRVTTELEAADGTVRSRVWRSMSPFSESALADRVWWQARAWVDTGVIPGGVVRIRLDPSDLSGAGRQLGMFEDVMSQVEAERAFARAQAIVGPEAVLQAQPQGGRLPTEQVDWRQWGEPESKPERSTDDPWPGATPSPAPALIPPRPTRFEVEWEGGIPTRVRLGTRWEPVTTWAGPWRLTGRWWRDEESVDRYQIVTSAGAFLCTVGSDGTFLAGIYD